MAVVQISKIQIRRGLKSIGVPQLSSAELAWAVDTQELYIGNGSVAEGAPYVGNTKVLTENDNIIELASSYEFASTDPSIINTVTRPLGEKIDEIEVSVADFGAVGDGSTDNVAAFETAFEQLFRNTDTTYRKVLKVPNGTYLFLSDLEIPSNATIRGETQSNTILKINDSDILFVTSEGLSVADFNSSNRPKNIEISNLTIERVTGQTVLSGVESSNFNNITFIGEHQLSDSVANLTSESSAVFFNNSLFGTATTDIRFYKCTFQSNSISIKCIQTDQFDTSFFIHECNFDIGHTSIYIEGVSEQGNNWEIKNNTFNEISTNCFRSTNGIGTKIIGCDFQNCGNETNQSDNPIHEIIYFNETKNNIVLDNYGDRQQNAGVTNNSSKLAVSEVVNGELVNFIDRNYANIDTVDSPRTLAVFSTSNRFIKISYTLRLGSFNRTGIIMLNVNDEKDSINITDNFSYSARSQELLGSDPSNDPTFEWEQSGGQVITPEDGGPTVTNLEFLATLADNNSDSVNDTVILSYRNPLGDSAATGTISFDVSYGV